MIYCTTFISLPLALDIGFFLKISQRFKKFKYKKNCLRKPNENLRKENFLFGERKETQ